MGGSVLALIEVAGFMLNLQLTMPNLPPTDATAAMDAVAGLSSPPSICSYWGIFVIACGPSLSQSKS
jgi:hypothetical protein